MIPLRDDVPSGSVPFVSIGLIALNVLVFFYQASIGSGDLRAAEASIIEFGVVPCRVVGTCSVPGEFPPPVAYLLFFPCAPVLIVVIFGFFVRIVRWPALIVLGLWIAIQSINGLITATASAVGGEVTGGTAWLAHIGGFLAGIMLLFLIRPRRVGRL
jgi:membrane associated rhomboid family serine protease